MAQIDRFDFYTEIIEEGCCSLDIDKNKHGNYVLYDDHEVIVDSLEQQIEALEARIAYFESRF